METKPVSKERLVSPSVCVNSGKLVKRFSDWKNLTNNTKILEIIQGYTIPFKSVPYQSREPNTPKYSEIDEKLIDESVIKLLKTGAIVRSDIELGQFISTIFTVPKPDGTRRPILNLKNLNLFIENPHFKMETIKTASQLISLNCYMAVIDLRDAYHAIPINKHSQKYLKFIWRGKLYTYTCLPFGLSLAPYLFTKLTKPIIAKLREQGIILAVYLDDILIIGRDHKECQDHLNIVMTLLQRLGFTINYDKSQLIPCTTVKYLGFIINSVEMSLITKRKS